MLRLLMRAAQQGGNQINQRRCRRRLPRLHQHPAVPSRPPRDRKICQLSCDFSTIHHPEAYDLSFRPRATIRNQAGLKKKCPSNTGGT
jgi:hypothetical protein